MADTILVKRSATATKVPTTAQLALGEIAINTYDGIVYLKKDNGTPSIVALSGASFPTVNGKENWQPVSGLAPIESTEFDERVFLYSQGQFQALTMWFKIPSTYSVGRQINVNLGFYSPSSALVWSFQAIATLVRAGVDAVNSTTNQNTTATGDVTNTIANQYRAQTLALTDSAGKISTISVNPGDIIKVQLTRASTAGSEDLADVRMIPGATSFLI